MPKTETINNQTLKEVALMMKDMEGVLTKMLTNASKIKTALKSSDCLELANIFEKYPNFKTSKDITDPKDKEQFEKLLKSIRLNLTPIIKKLVDNSEKFMDLQNGANHNDSSMAFFMLLADRND